MTPAQKTYYTKTAQRLFGILQGLVFDNELKDTEVLALHAWLDNHSSLFHLEPFKSVSAILEDILADGVIDKDEKEMLLTICLEIENNLGLMNDATQIIQDLHGILSGIISDGQISTTEIQSLQKWLVTYKKYSDIWPINELITVVDKVLEDGVVDEKEEIFLLDFFDDFSEKNAREETINDDLYDGVLQTDSPIFDSIESVCENNPLISFKQKCFCFTGPANAGKRADLHALVKDRGGRATKSITVSLDYLVIGQKSSPAWVYSRYGRKIEGVKNWQQNNPKCNTIIVSESDFIQSLQI